MDAAEGHRLGIVDIRTGDRDVMETALEQARRLAASALGGYAAIKAMTEDREALRAALRAEAQTQNRAHPDMGALRGSRRVQGEAQTRLRSQALIPREAHAESKNPRTRCTSARPMAPRWRSG